MSPANKSAIAFILIAKTFCSAIANPLPENYLKIDQLISSNPQSALAQLSEIDTEDLDLTTKAIHFNAISRAYISLVYPKKALDAAEKAISFIQNEEPQWLY